MLIAGEKVHPIWFTPILPLLFLLSAFAVGLPMAIFISIVAGKGMGRPIELPVLTGLARYAQVFLGLFLAVYFGNIAWNNHWKFIAEGTVKGNMFALEILLFVVPFILLFFKKIRESRGGLLFASILVILSIMVHRFNVLLISYTPPFGGTYRPVATEDLVLIGIFSLYIFLYRAATIYLPIFPEKPGSVSR